MLCSHYSQSLWEAGCDEAGRGCLAGPVYAAAVVLPLNYKNKWLNDSKQLTEKQRQVLRPEIEKEAISFAVAQIDNRQIDEINILNASIAAMHLALDKLTITPQYIIVDGNRFKVYKNIPHACIIKGDGKYLSIAAASILAKTYRDDFMEKIHKEFPAYNWVKNKGYPTLEHRRSIAAAGISPLHRKSFRLSEPLKFPF